MYKNKEKLFLFETKKGVIPRPKFSIFSFQLSVLDFICFCFFLYGQSLFYLSLSLS